MLDLSLSGPTPAPSWWKDGENLTGQSLVLEYQAWAMGYSHKN